MRGAVERLNCNVNSSHSHLVCTLFSQVYQDEENDREVSMTPVERVRKIALLPLSKPPATAPILPPSQVTPLWKIKAAIRKIELLPAAPATPNPPVQTLSGAV